MAPNIRSFRCATAVAVGAFLTLGASSAAAQTRSLTWMETTRIEVPGPLGAMLGASGAFDPTTSTVGLHLQGRTLIQEDERSAMIMDLENSRWVSVDHEGQSYITMTFQEMAQVPGDVMEAAAAQEAGNPANRDAALEELERAVQEANANVEVRVSSQATGERQSIGGVTASRHLIVTEVEATAVPQGVDEPEGGTLVFLAELWQSTDVPSAETLYAEWARELANDATLRSASEDLARSGEAVQEDLAAMFAMWSPQIGAGLLRMSEEIGEIEGTTVRSSITVALVPVGATFDRDALLAWQPESMGDRVRSEAAGAARSAAAEAAREAISGLTGGLFGGRRNNDPPPPAEEPPDVRPMLRITTDRENIAYRESDDDVLADLEARISGYRAITYADFTAQLQQQ